MNISENEIHIYHTSLEISAEQLTDFAKILSGDEIERADKFKFEKHKRRYIAARSFLRNILSQYIHIPADKIIFAYTDKGKPYIPNSKIKFNLAHSHERAVYAVTLNDEIGIDIEHRRKIEDAMEIAKRFFSKDEIEALTKLEEQHISDAFLNCWTRKEAFIKAVGEGLSYPLADFSVSIDNDWAEILRIKKAPEEISEWQLINVEVNGEYVSALAVKRQLSVINYQLSMINYQ